MFSGSGGGNQLQKMALNSSRSLSNQDRFGSDDESDPSPDRMSDEEEDQSSKLNAWGLTYNPYARLKEVMQKKQEANAALGIKPIEIVDAGVSGRRPTLHERLSLAFKRKHILQQL